MLFITVGRLLDAPALLDSDVALCCRVKHYAARELLLLDEVGLFVVFEPARRFAIRVH